MLHLDIRPSLVLLNEERTPKLAGLGRGLGALFCVTLLVSAVTGGNMFQAWNVGITLVWYPGQRKSIGNDYFRPLFDVADNGLRWVSDKSLPAWVELAWDEPQTINAARIVTGQTGEIEPKTPIIDFVLQYHDGTDWKDVPGTETSDNWEFDWNAKFAPVTAPRFRLLVTASPGDIIRLWELELYRLPKP